MFKDLIINENWEFIKEDVLDAQKIDINVENWENVSLPHTWNDFDVQEGGGKRSGLISGKKPGYYRGVGWYRKRISIPSEYANKRIFILFEAAGSVAETYINENYLGKHLGAFSAFCFEVTPYINFEQENILGIKVNNAWRSDLPPLGGDFPVMGGLYRTVHLIIKEKTCISPLDYASSGVYIAQKSVSNEKTIIEVKTKISKIDENVKNLLVDSTIFDAKGEKVQKVESKLTELNQEEMVTQIIEIENPHLWNGRIDPYLYKLKVVLIHENEILDEVVHNLGLRYYYIDPEKGFFLNGKPYMLNGVNRHQDRFNKGWAISYEDQDQDMELMLEMGVNAVRLAHYQHSDYFYSLCDKKGILVWAELSIVNKVSFSKAFLENSKSMLIDLIRQNYNHPSIFTWSLANEIGFFQLRSPNSVMKKLNVLAHKEDPTRPTILAAISLAFFRKKLHRITDLIGWNHYPGWYYFNAEKMGSHVRKFNKYGKYRGLCVSEYGAGASIYQHKQNLKHDDKIKASGHFHPEEKQNIVHEENYRQMQMPFVWGTFVWNMFDFAVAGRDEGDTPGRNDKGLVTYDRKVKKDAYFFYKANWTSDPMVYITSRRHVERNNHITEVKIYSNCEDVELKVNGKIISMMVKEDLSIFRVREIELKEGENNIEVIGSIGNTSAKDSCTWKFSN